MKFSKQANIDFMDKVYDLYCIIPMQSDLVELIILCLVPDRLPSHSLQTLLLSVQPISVSFRKQ